MSQINVNTIAARTGSDISVASGHTLKDSSDNAFITSSGLTLISSQTSQSSVSAVTFDNVFTSTYLFYKLVFTYEPSTTADFRMVFRNGGASGSDITANYDSKYTYLTTSQTSYSMGTSGAGQSYITLMNGTAANSDYGLNIEMYNPFVSSKKTTGFMQGSWKDGGQLQTGFSHDSEESCTGFKLYVATGTMAGDYLLYGYAK